MGLCNENYHSVVYSKIKRGTRLKITVRYGPSDIISPMHLLYREGQ